MIDCLQWPKSKKMWGNSQKPDLLNIYKVKLVKFSEKCPILLFLAWIVKPMPLWKVEVLLCGLLKNGLGVGTTSLDAVMSCSVQVGSALKVTHSLPSYFVHFAGGINDFLGLL